MFDDMMWSDSYEEMLKMPSKVLPKRRCSRQTWTVDDFEVAMSACLQYGVSGQYYRGINKVTHEEVAIKVFKNIPSNDKKIQRLLEMEHVNIVKVFAAGVVQSGFLQQKYVIVMEYCCFGTLADILQSGQGLADAEYLLLIKFLRKVYHFLLLIKEVHADIRPETIYVNDDMNGGKLFKLMDFKSAREEDEVDCNGASFHWNARFYSRSGAGTPTSPEYVDLWSIGATLYEAATATKPIQVKDGHKNDELPKTLQVAYDLKKPRVIHMTKESNGTWTQSTDLPNEKLCISKPVAHLVKPMIAGLMEKSKCDCWTPEIFLGYSKALIEFRPWLIRYQRTKQLLKEAQEEINMLKNKSGREGISPLLNHSICEEDDFPSVILIREQIDSASQRQVNRNISSTASTTATVDSDSTDPSHNVTTHSQDITASIMRQNDIPNFYGSIVTVDLVATPLYPYPPSGTMKHNLETFKSERSGYAPMTYRQDGYYDIIDWSNLPRSNLFDGHAVWNNLKHRDGTTKPLWFPPIALPRDHHEVLIEMAIERSGSTFRLRGNIISKSSNCHYDQPCPAFIAPPIEISLWMNDKFVPCRSSKIKVHQEPRMLFRIAKEDIDNWSEARVQIRLVK